MSEDGIWQTNIPEGHDGRFGDHFDDEVDSPKILQIVLGLAVLIVVSMVVSWWVLQIFLGQTPAAAVVPSPLPEASQRRLPPAPRLQSDPEEELRQMRREMATRLNSYGWVDENRGIVRIPIDRAMEVLLTAGGTDPGAGLEAGQPAAVPAPEAEKE